MTKYLSILVKQQSKFLCWNSFKAEWFWGPKRLSEKFPWEMDKYTKAKQMAELHGGKVVFVTVPEGEATFIEETW